MPRSSIFRMCVPLCIACQDCARAKDRQPLPADHDDHEKRRDESGKLHVQNLSVNELPEIALTKEISGTVYTVTGSYDGIELLDRKQERVMERHMTDAEAEE